MRQLNQDHLAIIDAWEKQFPGKFTADQGNVDLILGYIRNKCDGIVSVENLNTAARACHSVLRFVPGHEPPDPRADVKVKLKADADELEKKRQRELRLRAGLNVDQSKITTEFDRGESQKPDPAKAADARIVMEQLAAKRDFEQICNGYAVIRNGRKDYAKTEARQKLLRQISVKRGDVLLYTVMVKRAEEMLRQFEVEDSRRTMV
jgi:hypothetical protein